MTDNEGTTCLVEGVSEMSLADKTSAPVRRVNRNKSGGRLLGVSRTRSGRAPPRRSQSSKIKRPAFDPASAAADVQPRRGVNRTHSKGSSRNVPARSGSFQRRRVPDRTSSTSSLRRAAVKRQQQSGNISVTNSTAETDDISVSDSVFTSISIQTMDSIAVRKKQIPLNEGKGGVNRKMDIEFDGNANGVGDVDYYEDEGDAYEYDEDLSVFSESWCSETGDVLSDYEEGEMDGAILEDEAEESDETSPNQVGSTSAE